MECCAAAQCVQVCVCLLQCARVARVTFKYYSHSSSPHTLTHSGQSTRHRSEHTHSHTQIDIAALVMGGSAHTHSQTQEARQRFAIEPSAQNTSNRFESKIVSVFSYADLLFMERDSPFQPVNCTKKFRADVDKESGLVAPPGTGILQQQQLDLNRIVAATVAQMS